MIQIGNTCNKALRVAIAPEASIYTNTDTPVSASNVHTHSPGDGGSLVGGHSTQLPKQIRRSRFRSWWRQTAADRARSSLARDAGGPGWVGGAGRQS